MLRSVPGLPAASEPAQLPPITYQLPQASVWQGGPGPMGAPGQLVQLLPSMWLNPMVQLPPGVQFCSLAAPCPPAHGWGQQVMVGMLVPLQPMGVTEDSIRSAGPHLATAPGKTTTKRTGEIWGWQSLRAGVLRAGKLAWPQGWAEFDGFFSRGDHPQDPSDAPGPA